MKRLQKKYKRLIILIFFNFILIHYSNANKYNISNTNFFIPDDTCMCASVSFDLTHKLITIAKLKNINIIVSGEPIITDTINNFKTWGGVKIVNCNGCKIIREDTINNMNCWYSVESYNDTLFLNYYIIRNYKKPFILFQTYYTNNNDSIITNYRFYKDIKFADKNELLNLEKEYTNFNENYFNENDNLIGQEYSMLQVKKLNKFGWQLLYSAISGDTCAMNRLCNYKKYYPFINAGWEEEFLFYVVLYKNLQGILRSP